MDDSNPRHAQVSAYLWNRVMGALLPEELVANGFKTANEKVDNEKKNSEEQQQKLEKLITAETEARQRLSHEHVTQKGAVQLLEQRVVKAIADNGKL